MSKRKKTAWAATWRGGEAKPNTITSEGGEGRALVYVSGGLLQEAPKKAPLIGGKRRFYVTKKEVKLYPHIPGKEKRKKTVCFVDVPY